MCVCICFAKVSWSLKTVPLCQHPLLMGDLEALVIVCVRVIARITCFIYHYLCNKTDYIMLHSAPEFIILNQGHYQDLCWVSFLILEKPLLVS